jgi:hypothetical protein
MFRTLAGRDCQPPDRDGLALSQRVDAEDTVDRNG